MLDSAYSKTLKIQDTMLLIKLMCYTGVCIRSLNATVVELLITEVIKIMDEEDFLNVLLVGWIPEITRFLIKSKG